MNRVEALELLKEYTKKEGLITHGLAVEAAMRFYAEKFGEDVEEWGIIGLIHDFDYERFPSEEEHPFKGGEILREKGISEMWIRAIMSHASYTGLKRETLMEKTLFAVDELTGFITACALVRPSKSVNDLKVKSVKKKMKNKQFAAAVNREEIVEGAELLGFTLEEHIENVIEAMRRVSEKLGL